MNSKILTIIFGTLATMFAQLNDLILAGCEAPPVPDKKDYPTAAEALAKMAPPEGAEMAGTGATLDAAAILAGAPVIPQAGGVPADAAANLTPEVKAPPAPVKKDPNARVDVEGLPWDKRIHSSGKTFYKSKAANGAPAGAWKIKKGVDPVLVAQIKTELAGGYTPPEDAITTQTAPHLDAGPIQTGPGETTETCTDIYTWADLVEKATAAGITPQVMAAACQKFNVPGIIELQDQALLIPAVGKELGL